MRVKVVFTSIPSLKEGSFPVLTIPHTCNSGPTSQQIRPVNLWPIGCNILMRVVTNEGESRFYLLYLAANNPEITPGPV